jgi:hypothetical protein
LRVLCWGCGWSGCCDGVGPVGPGLGAPASKSCPFRRAVDPGHGLNPYKSSPSCTPIMQSAPAGSCGVGVRSSCQRQWRGGPWSPCGESKQNSTLDVQFLAWAGTVQHLQPRGTPLPPGCNFPAGAMPTVPPIGPGAPLRITEEPPMSCPLIRAT